MDGPGGHYPSWGNTSTKELTQYVLTDKWILAQNLGYPRYKIQIAKRMKPKRKEDQSVDTVPLLRIGNKTPMEGVTETKVGRLLMSASISLGDIGLFRSLTWSWFNFGTRYLSRNLFISSRFPSLLSITFCRSIWWCFGFVQNLLLCLPFHFWFC